MEEVQIQDDDVVVVAAGAVVVVHLEREEDAGEVSRALWDVAERVYSCSSFQVVALEALEVDVQEAEA